MKPAAIFNLFIVAILAGAIILVAANREWLNVAALENFLGAVGPWGILIFFIIYVLATILFAPGTVLALAGGVLFGPYLGTAVNLLAATTGATLAFLIARYLAADWISGWIERKAGRWLTKIFKGIEDEGWRFVVFVRLVPLFPFNVLNYALGLTRLNLFHYIAASFVCMLPGAAAYTCLGYAGREAVAGGEGYIQKGLLGLGLVVMVVFLPRLIKRLRPATGRDDEASGQTVTSKTEKPLKPIRPKRIKAARQDTLPGRYDLWVKILSLAAFAYVVFAFANARMLHWVVGADGAPPIWLSTWTEYLVIAAFGTWRITAETNPYTRKRLIFLTASVVVFWWMFPYFLQLPELYIGDLPRTPVFPQFHTPGTVTFFAILALVFLFGRRVVCGWNCPCVGIRETVGFPFREKTLRSETAWYMRHTKWFFFALYVAAAIFIFAPLIKADWPAAATLPLFMSFFMGLVAVTYFGSFFLMPLTGNRFYCRYMCPYGATFGLLNRAGFYQIRMATDKCIDCGKCEHACDMGIPVWRQGLAHGKVTGIEDCMGCARCVLSCPTDALEIQDVRNKFLPGLTMNASHLMKRNPS